jgi:phosphatidylglycerol:prolipoprotein diacylglycerol transferase
VTYGVGRLVVEGLRTDSLYIGPLPGPVWASMAFVVLGLAIAAVSRRPLPSPGAAAD